MFQNLNNLIPPGSGFTLDNATAISGNGQIVASGSNAQARSTRSCSHPASDRVQDLPPARLIHAGRSGRLRGRDCSHHLAERTDTGGGPP